MAVTDSSGQLQGDLVLYEPFGNYRSTPPDETNPDITDRGYTNQKHNNDLELIYYGARYYMPGIGRFLSPDTIVPDYAWPQSMNRYSYVINNPVKFSDPSGHCPRPPGNNASMICLSLFIAPETVKAGPLIVHGDNRDFQPDSDPAASRGYIWINTDTGESEFHMNPSGYFIPEDIPFLPGIRYFPPSEKNSWDVNIDDGLITVSYDLVISGPLDWTQAAPHINGTVQFIINDDGSIDYAFNRDGFPWAEAYIYNGNQTEVIFQDPAARGQPYDLFGIEPDISLPGYVAFYFQSLSLQEPQINSHGSLWE